MAISAQGVLRSTSCLVLRWGFRVGGSNGAISGLTKSKMAARPPSLKIQIAIYPRRIIRFKLTPCVFGPRMEFSGSADRITLFPVGPSVWETGENNARGVIRLVTI